MSLAGKTALVTGSTSGIGLGIAELLAKAGANIVLNGMGDVVQIEATRARLAAEHGVKVSFEGADMSRPEAIEAMFQAIAAEFGSADILVNNAGIQHVAPIEEFPVAKWDAIIAINLTAAFHTIRLALPGMKQKNGAASSRSLRRMRWWLHPTNPPMSPPSTVSPDSPRR